VSHWSAIPADQDIKGYTCVLVRRRKVTGGWGVAIAYKTVRGVWKLDPGHCGIDGYHEWHPIPP
jgi:hypothetical protein